MIGIIVDHDVESPVLKSICWKCIAEHGRLTLRLLRSGFVLNDIPVLHENAVLYAQNISRDPIHHCPKPGKTPMCDNEVSFGNDQTSFVTQSIWKGLYQVE